MGGGGKLERGKAKMIKTV